eukprot:SAG22_NODE_622_length_8493_cov_196.309864_4_plen_60_part_00
MTNLDASTPARGDSESAASEEVGARGGAGPRAGPAGRQLLPLMIDRARAHRGEALPLCL